MLISSIRFLLLSLLFSGLFKAASLYIDLNLNYLLVPAFLCLGLFTLALGSKLRFNSSSTLFLIFFILSGLFFLINNAYQDNNYTDMQLFLALLMQSIVPVCLILFASTNKMTRNNFVLDNIVDLILKANILVFGIYLIAVNVNYQSVLNFYGNLLAGGVIINPFQTSVEGIAIRFSGIFNSGFLLASFCCVAINYLYFRHACSKSKFLLMYLLLFLIVILTYNRNGIIAFLLGTIFIVTDKYFAKAYSKLLATYFYFVLSTLCILPLILLYFSDSIFSNIGGARDETALTKVSTLLSRIEAWIIVLKIDNIKDLLLGTGLVQGLGENNDNFYVDNGYLYLLNQGGLILLIFYLLCWMLMFSSLMSGLKRFSNDIYLRNEIYLCLSLIAVSMTIALLNNFFFEPLFLILVLMKCLTVNNKISCYYER
ncbi:O-antigen ligase family protein [Enterobacter mori]|uniref:O-antigen ligase family protein n=1 Tax=Enterobacter mori TaxID=539813 RepID=UPI00241ED502|nr:O-antigen ligase family protein [Enterobacter mori]